MGAGPPLGMKRAGLGAFLVLAACGDSEPGVVRAIEVELGSVAPETAESGEAVELRVRLTAPPDAVVRVGVATDAPGEAQASAAEVRFEVGEVGPKTVRVIGVDDAVVDGDRTYHVLVGPSVSDDDAYDGLLTPLIELVNRDDDAEVPMATLTVAINAALAGDGVGRVVSTPPGIDCPGTCAAPFAVGALVTLVATAGTGNRFGGWLRLAPAMREFSPSIEVEVAADGTIESAVFVQERFAWEVAVDGPAGERLRAVAADDKSAVVVGSIDGPTTIGGIPLPFGGNLDALIVSYDVVDRAHRWSAAFGGTGAARATAVTQLPVGDVIVAGEFSGELVIGDTMYGATLVRRSFIARLAATDGAVVWSRLVDADPAMEIADLAAYPDGSFLACGAGAGAAVVARFDGAGALVDDVQVPEMSTCSAVAVNAGGAVIAGWGEDASIAVAARLQADLAVVQQEVLGIAGGPLLVDDIVQAADGSTIVAVTAPQGVGFYRSTLIRLTADGNVTTASAGLTTYFGRSLALAARPDDGPGFVVARRDDFTGHVFEQWSIAPLEPIATAAVHGARILEFAVASNTTDVFLLGLADTESPLPAWNLPIGPPGSFLTKLASPLF
jgi:hypothetical protein